MEGHKIFVRHAKAVPLDRRLSIPLLKDSIRTALTCENVGIPCEVNVLVTDDKGIREVNREFRGMDRPTDVLSFPMQEFSPGEYGGAEHDPETGLVPLGDIVLSVEHVDKQAMEYGQSRAREAVYLSIHSVLHLLGYDHVDEAEEKRQMRRREEAIMECLDNAEKL